MDDLHLNVSLLRRRVPNLTTAAKSVGLRPATVSNLCTGKIPVGRAEVRTIATLAALANCTLDELVIRGTGGGLIETGIKIIDVFAPLVRGGTIGFVARSGVGQLVVLAEIFFRLKKRAFSTVFWTDDARSDVLSELTPLCDAVCFTEQEAYEKVASLREHGDVLLGAERSKIMSGELYELQSKLNDVGDYRLTTALVDSTWVAADEEAPYGPLDVKLHFDNSMAARNLYPAISPLLSTSVLHESGQLDASHATILQRSRRLLRRYDELRALAAVRGWDGVPDKDLQSVQRGERLEAYLTQPFHVAEPYTHKRGGMVSLQDALDDIRFILDGGVLNMGIENFMFRGRIQKSYS